MTHFVRFMERLNSYSSLSCMEGDATTFTYADLLKEVNQWRSRLDEIGITRGSVVGLRADYSLSAVGALLALVSRASVAALIPRHGDTDNYLKDACAETAIELSLDGHYQWRSVSHRSDHPLLQRLRTDGDGGFVIFTSGSTGRPKAALHSLEHFLHKFQRPGRRYRTLAFLLLDHVAGLDTLFYTLAHGGTLILTRQRDPRSILQAVQSQKVEVLPCSPSFLRLLCSTTYGHAYDVSSLSIITYGSEPMDSGTLVRLNERFPNAQISQKYGTTEIGSPRTVSRSSDSLWVRIKGDGVEMKVLEGTLWLRSKAAMLGYLNASASIDDQGWYCTGDLVDVDGEWLRFRGRASDIINVGGEKVFPIEVEQSILELDFVRDAVICGEAHPLMGQVVTAQIVLTTEAPPPKEAIKRIRLHCQQNLASYKVPMKVAVVAEICASERQKIQRRRPPS